MYKDRIYFRVLEKLIKKGLITKGATILVVCGGKLDELILKELGFDNVLITNISKGKLSSGFKNKVCDAHRLPFKNDSFDYALVHAGLHHCRSPHLVLYEMYRVSKKGVLACEAQDNLFTRLLLTLNLIEEYEFSSTGKPGGGVDGTGIPNYVYRWNKREIEKFVRSLDYKRKPEILYFSEFNFPKSVSKKNIYGWGLSFLAENFVTIANSIVPAWGNSLCFFISKQNMKLHRWISTEKNT